MGGLRPVTLRALPGGFDPWTTPSLISLNRAPFGYMYYDHSTRMYYDHSTCTYYDHSTCMYYVHSTCIYYERRTCMSYDHRTCMYYDRSTCMYYDHRSCIMSYGSHVRRNSVGGSGGAKPPMGGTVGTVTGFWGLIPSRGMVNVGLLMNNSHNPEILSCIHTQTFMKTSGVSVG